MSPTPREAATCRLACLARLVQLDVVEEQIAKVEARRLHGGPESKAAPPAAEREVNGPASTRVPVASAKGPGGESEGGSSAVEEAMAQIEVSKRRGRLQVAPAPFEDSAPFAPMASLEARSGLQQPRAAA
mgnify:CR=1 FL=1